MKIYELEKLIKDIRECDDIILVLGDTHKEVVFDMPAPCSWGLRNAMIGSVIERRASLLDQLSRHGIKVEV